MDTQTVVAETANAVVADNKSPGRIYRWINKAKSAVSRFRLEPIVEVLDVIKEEALWRICKVQTYARPGLGMHFIINETDRVAFVFLADGTFIDIKPGKTYGLTERLVEPVHAGTLPLISFDPNVNFRTPEIGNDVVISSQIYRMAGSRVRVDKIGIGDSDISLEDLLRAAK